MAHISAALIESLQRNRPKPVVGDGYSVEVRGRGAVQYFEKGAIITMFSDLIERSNEPLHGSWLARLLARYLGKYCLGVYIESPLHWDNDDTTEMSEVQEALIVKRIAAALAERTSCYKIERGPNPQATQLSNIKSVPLTAEWPKF